MADMDTLLTRNLHEVFGERDAAKRNVTIAEIWRDDGTFIDPFGSHIGHGALDEAVVRLHEQFLGFVFTELSPPQTFHGIGRIAWGFGPPNEVPRVTGLDVGVAKDGRLSVLYAFIDEPKA